ncbi:MAG: hypothetical protein HYY16_06300 [Planctomycetes bacterium]|nr:hypothetical protein [Planctomycetota bacterium]
MSDNPSQLIFATPWYTFAQSFMTAVHARVRRAQLYPQWMRNRDNDSQVKMTFRALTAMELKADFQVEPPGLKINDLPVNPIRGGNIVWDFASLLSEILIARLTLTKELNVAELSSLTRALANAAPPASMPPNYWARVLESEKIAHASIEQRPYISSPEDGETVMFLTGRLSGDRALDPEETALLKRAVETLMTASELLRQTDPESPAAQRAIAGATDHLATLLSRARLATLVEHDGQLLANGQGLEGEASQKLAQELKRKACARLTIKDGLTLPEGCALVSLLSIPSEDPHAEDDLRAILRSNFIRRFLFQHKAAAIEEPAAVPVPPPTPPPAPAKAAGPTESARQLLSQAPDTFLGSESQRIFPNLIQGLSGGTDAEVGTRLLSRLAMLLEHKSSLIRCQALTLVRRTLRELKGNALPILLTATRRPLVNRLPAESDTGVHPILAETLQLWLSVAILSGHLDLAAGVITQGVQPAVQSAAIPIQYRTALQSKLRLAGQQTGMALVQALAKGTAKAQEDAALLLQNMGSALAPLLTKLSSSGDPAVAQAASTALHLLSKAEGKGAVPQKP